MLQGVQAVLDSFVEGAGLYLLGTLFWLIYQHLVALAWLQHGG